MRKQIRFIIIVLAALMSVPLFAQNVTNTDCRQEGNKIVVTYNLDKPSDIELWYSTDGGRNYKGPLKKVSGDVGKNVHSGYNSIVWDVLEEVEGLSGAGIVFKVVPGSVPSGYENGYEWVNLGLSVKWATCNLGAKKPEDYGDYYAWGETSPKKDYSWSTYKLCKGTENTLTKYCGKSACGYNGFTDNKKLLDLSDDAAHIKLGGRWRIPTCAEWTELRTKCKWNWIGNGYKVTGPNGNSIFLPAAGYRHDASFDSGESYGGYWSSSLFSGSSCRAFLAYFRSYDFGRYNVYRCYGRSIRPVTK